MSWGGAIGSGIGGLVTRVHGRKERKHREKMQHDQWVEEERVRQQEYGRQDTAYQRAVKDAQAAGLHPLFALGGAGAASGSFSPSAANIDYGPSGAEHFGQAGREIGDALEQKSAEERQKVLDAQAVEMANAQRRVLESEANRNDAVAESHRMSTLARASQEANVRQDGVKKVMENQPAELYTRGMDNPLRWPKGKTKAQDVEDYYGDIAQNIEGTAMYVQDKAQQIAEWFQELLKDYTYRGVPVFKRQ